MILAAAAFAEGLEDVNGNKVPPPPELLLALKIEQWGVSMLFSEPLPIGEIRRMTAALNVYRAFISFRSGAHNSASWAQSHPGDLDIITSVRELRLREG